MFLLIFYQYLLFETEKGFGYGYMPDLEFAKNLVHHPVGQRGAFTVAGANRLTQQMVYHCLDKRLLHMFRITDADFFASLFGMQSDRLVSKDRETNHSLVADNLYTVFAGGIMGDETP